MANELADEDASQRQVFGKYSESLKRVYDGLSEEVKKQCSEQAVEWNRQGPPPHVQEK
jgi:hypothetical protein